MNKTANDAITVATRLLHAEKVSKQERERWGLFEKLCVAVVRRDGVEALTSETHKALWAFVDVVIPLTLPEEDYKP